MTLRTAVAVKNAEASATISAMNGGSVQLRTGTPAALITDAAAGTLLATVVLPNPALNAVSNGVATMNAVTNVAAAAGGTIGHGRILKSDGTILFDGTVTLAGGGGDIIATVMSVAIGDPVGITAFSYARS